MNEPAKKYSEVTLGEIRLLFRKLGKVFWISLTGGEPFLRKDLVEIMEIAFKETGCRVLSLTTNGFDPRLISRRLSEVLELRIPLIFVNVSLDGPMETHNFIRGVECYSNAIKTLKRLQGLQEQYDNFRYGMEYTLSPLNAGQLRRLIDDLNSHGLSPHCTLTIFHVGGLYHNLNSSIKLDKLDMEAALRDIAACRKYGSTDGFPMDVVRNIYLHYSKHFLAYGRAPMSCVALRDSLFIDPYGNIHPCIILGEKVTHYRDLTKDFIERGMKSYWKNRYRDCKRCWTPCEAYPSIIRKYFLLLKP